MSDILTIPLLPWATQTKDELLYLQDKLRNNLETMGIEGLTDETLNALVDEVPNIPTGAGSQTNLWTRPLDRPEKPEMVDDTVLILFGVSRDSPNDLALRIYCIGGYTIIGADGTVSNHNSSTKAEFMYDFDSINAPVDSQGYKMCWITIRPTLETGAITNLDLQQRHSLRSTISNAVVAVQIFELYIQCPSLISMPWASATTFSYTVYCRMLEIISLDINNITSALTNFASYCPNLQLIEKLYVDKVTVMLNFLRESVSFNGILPIESAVYDKVTESFMNGCRSYNRPFQKTFTKISSNSFTGMSAYNHTITANPSITYITLTDLHALKGVRIPNMLEILITINITNTSLDVPALNLLGGDLMDRTGLTAGTLTVTNCFGSAMWSAEDRALVQAKNWTIIG